MITYQDESPSPLSSLLGVNCNHLETAAQVNQPTYYGFTGILTLHLHDSVLYGSKKRIFVIRANSGVTLVGGRGEMAILTCRRFGDRP